MAGRRPTLFVLALVGAFGVGCSYSWTDAADGAATSESGPSCFIGELGCECTLGGGCDPGLECDAGVCVEPGTEETAGACTSAGCACEETADCDPGLICEANECISTTCGDGIVDPGEACDDANEFDGDGCDNDCSETEILALALGGVHTCALIEGGRVRCWGSNSFGQIGTGNFANVGDDEPASAAVDLPLPAVVDIAAGGSHTCAILENGDLRCWGGNGSGQLGLGNTAAVTALGDDETIAGAIETDLGAPVQEVSLGVAQSCGLANNTLRCWGAGLYGQLGTSSTMTIGDDEVPLAIEAVMIGAEPVKLAVGASHGCVLLGTGGLRCWGRGNTGQLGYGSNQNVGDNEHPVTLPEIDAVPPVVPPGTTVLEIGAGLGHTCARLSSNDVICWGKGDVGQLGNGDPMNWGDQPNELPSGLAPIALGGPALGLAVGYEHNCALLDNGQVRCWGEGSAGQLGYGNEDNVGLATLPAEEDPVQLGAQAVAIYAGGAHTCAILVENEVICWGNNDFGQLGYGHTILIGDDEVPEVAGPIEVL